MVASDEGEALGEALAAGIELRDLTKSWGLLSGRADCHAGTE